MKNIKVLNPDGEIEKFSPVKIRNNLTRETQLPPEEAEKIKTVIVNRLKKAYSEDGEISTTVIRGMVIDELIKRGYTEEAKQYKIYGVSNSYINNLLQNGCRDNANIMNTTELVNKYICDAVWKTHALDNMPKECADAHKENYIHIHDLEYFELRSNCCNWDIRWFARNNLMVDGEGKLGSVAKPAQKLEVLVHHLLEVMGAGTQVLSGGQAFSHWNVFLAPFAKGRTYEDVKQCMQHYIFSSNMQGFSRGGQSIFSSINLEFEIPEFLKDVPAIGPAGVTVGVYGDYQQESDMIFKAVVEVLKEKDAIGRFHTFPNTIFVIRENTLDEYSDKVKLVHELLAENPTIYFMNCIGENSIVMGCRTRLSQNYTGDWEKDLLNVGNFHYTTINLPLLALESKNLSEFKRKLTKYMNISREVLFKRRENVEHIFQLGMSNFLIQKDKSTDEPLYDIDRCSFSIGLCGLNEALLELYNKNITQIPEKGEEIIKHMSEWINEHKVKDGLRWSLFFSPAESTAHRFATYNKNKYPDAHVQGEKGSYYLTNSSHINVSDAESLSEHIKNADRFHKYAGAGNILHLWLGEAYPDPEALFKLNQKISRTSTKFWAFTNDYTYCRRCGFAIQLAYDVCPICGDDDVVVMSRITGYYQPVGGYNDGKKKEFKDRFRHKV